MSSSRSAHDDRMAQVQLLAELYSAGYSSLEIRETLVLSERQFAALFLQAQQEGLLTYDPTHVRGARFGSSLKKELIAMLGIAKGDEPILLLTKTPEGVLISLRSTSATTSTETFGGGSHV